MDGFFPESELLASKSPPRLHPQCGKCGLLNGCKSPKMAVYGQGKRNILVVGEAPGRTEDETGKPFQGKAGLRLQRTLRSVGVDLFQDCWVTNALSCRPPENKIPKDVMIEYCRPLVVNAIERLRPVTIILLGGYAVRSVVGGMWREDPGGIGRWRGFRIPSQRYNAWICPAYHPSYLERMGDNPDPVAEREFRDDLAAAVRTAARRPWATVPDYRSEVRTAFASDEAATLLRYFNKPGEPVAFDFETDRLKAHHPDAWIACCSVSDGKRTLAFPWHGNAARIAVAMFQDPAIPKIGANIKFEQTWCMSRLHIRVRGWVWDVCTDGHCCDARTGITSVKFQAFVRLGVEDYSAAVGPFLESRDGGGNSPNRVREVDMRSLFVYCGMDSLCEYKVAHLQARELQCSLP